MYCGKCGRELTEETIFCPSCGTKIIRNSMDPIAQSEPEKQVKPIGGIIIGVLSVFVVVFLGFVIIVSVNYIKSIPSDEELRMASNNSMNGALATTDGKWLFYFGVDDEGLCREKLSNGKKREVIIPKRWVGELFFLGDKIYTGTSHEFSTVKINGKDLYEIPNTFDCLEILKTDGKTIFFRPFDPDFPDGVCSQKLNGEEVKQVIDIPTSEILYYNDYLYLLSRYGKVNGLPNENYGVYMVEPDGTNPKRIFDDLCPAYFIFGEEKIYYTCDGFLYSMNFDGSDQKQVGNIQVKGGLNVSKDYIYYVDANDSYIHRVDLDDVTDNKVLNGHESESINIVGDWIVYKNIEDNEAIYKMKIDGSENRFLSRYE